MSSPAKTPLPIGTHAQSLRFMSVKFILRPQVTLAAGVFFPLVQGKEIIMCNCFKNDGYSLHCILKTYNSL